MASINPDYNTERMRLGEQLPLNTPLSVILDVSECCNFRCSYCFRAGKKDESWSYAALNELMSFESFTHAAEQLALFPQKIKLVSLSGHGEPLCNPRISDMARYLKKQGVAERIDMHTNASLLTRENVKSIANAGFDRIVISLQGLDAADYKRICGAEIDWELFYNNLKLLYENKDNNLKLHIKIADTALDSNDLAGSEEKFYMLFKDIADSVFVEKIVPIWKNLRDGTETNVNKFGTDFSDVDYCPIVFYKMLISPNGDIYPCTNLPPPMSLGNIYDTTMQDAWNGTKRREFLMEHLRLTRHSHTPCTGCFVPVNTVMAREDIIDPYKDAIRERLEGLSENG